MDLKCFDRIRIREPSVSSNAIRAAYEVEGNGHRFEFVLQNKYEEEIQSDHVDEFAKAMIILPAINYGLFADAIEFDFDLGKDDLQLFTDMMEVTAREIYVNRIANATGYVEREFVPNVDDIVKEDARPRANVFAKYISRAHDTIDDLDYGSNAVMSSGGKESLLSYCVLKEVGQRVYPCFFNESGGHWRTAISAYRFMRSEDPKTKRVWSNVDRLYSLFDRNMRILRRERVGEKSDIYPIRLFFFEHYVFSFLPILYKYKIGNVNLGNEFDDPLTLRSRFRGIRHYMAVYDQSQEFDDYMTTWFRERGFNFRQWSAVRPLSGLLVERVLSARYARIFRLQRSCHSVVRGRKGYMPCGNCKKCLGILTFLMANGIDPRLIGYSHKDIKNYKRLIIEKKLNLDRDEFEHSKYLAKKLSGIGIRGGKPHGHVESLHFERSCSRPDVIPRRLWKIYDIYAKYSKGYSIFRDGRWTMVSKGVALKT